MTTAKCPLCRGPVLRIRRRLIDRIVSLLRPVARYRCQSARCQWEGNLPRLR